MQSKYATELCILCTNCQLKIDFTNYKIPSFKEEIGKKLQCFFRIPDPTQRSLPKATWASCMNQMLHGDPKIAHEHVLQDRETYAAIRDGDPMSVPFQKKASPCGKGELAVSLNGVRPGFLAEDRFMQKPMEHLTFLYHKSKYMWVHCLRCQTTVGIWKVKGSEAETADAMDRLNRFLLTDKQSYKEYKKMIRGGAAAPSQALLSVPVAPDPTKAESDTSSDQDEGPDALCYHWEKANPPQTPAPEGFTWTLSADHGWILKPNRRPA